LEEKEEIEDMAGMDIRTGEHMEHVQAVVHEIHVCSTICQKLSIYTGTHAHARTHIHARARTHTGKCRQTYLATLLSNPCM
jgi:hypothetical protein